MSRVYLDEKKPDQALKLIPPTTIHPGASLGTEAVWLSEGRPYGEWLLAVEQGEDRVRDAHRHQGEICAQCRQAAPWHRGALVIHRLNAKTSTVWTCGLCLFALPGTPKSPPQLRWLRVPRLLFPGFQEPSLMQSALSGPAMPWVIEATRTLYEQQVYPQEPGFDYSMDKHGDRVNEGAILEARKKYAQTRHVSVTIYATQNLCNRMGYSADHEFIETQDQAWERLTKEGCSSFIRDYFQTRVASWRRENWDQKNWRGPNAAIEQVGQDLLELFTDGLSLVDAVEPWVSVRGLDNLDREWDAELHRQPPPAARAEGEDQQPDDSVQ